MHVDDVITELGEFGRYQRLVYMFVFVWACWSGMTMMGGIFLAAKVSHNCRVPEWNNSSASNIDVNMTELRTIALSTGSSCSMYKMDDIKMYYNDTQRNRSDLKNAIGNLSITNCVYGYDYGTGDYAGSLVSEFDLVCDRTALSSTSKAAMYVGTCIGGLVFGILSDRFGRKKILSICALLQVVFGLIASASPNVFFYFAFMILFGMCEVYPVAFTMGTELVGRKYRTIAGYSLHTGAAIGIMLLALLAYFIQSWRYLLVAITVPGVMAVGLFFIADESPRWLLQKGRTENAKHVFEQIAKKNSKHLNPVTIEKLTTISEDNKMEPGVLKSMLLLFRDWRLSLMTLNLWFSWTTCALVYFGLSYNLDNLGGSLYTNCIISVAAEVPGYVVCAALVNKLGRKKSLALSHGSAGLSIIASGLSQDIQWLSIGFSVFGKFAICASFGVVYLVTAEVYPTGSRNFAVSASRTVSRIGSISAPYVAALSYIWWPLPMFVMGVTALVAAALTFFLPETTGKKLPQNLEEYVVVAQGRRKNEDQELSNTANGI